MFVVRIDSDDARRFRAFLHLRDARFFLRHLAAEETDGEVAELFEVSETDDPQAAVLAVRDGRAMAYVEPEPDQAVILASMGLGTGLRL